jgi:predicted acetyltransferase
MREIRELLTLEQGMSITLTSNAYPGLGLTNRANRARYRDRLSQLETDPTVHSLGLFEDGQMRGVMRWYDFRMNFFGAETLVGGVGGIAVDLLHKKEKVAAEMVQAFLHHYKDKGSSLVALYPFRPDFYRRMGFGYGAPMYQYRFAPASLPKGPMKSKLSFLKKEDGERMHRCYNRYFRNTHGIMARQLDFWERWLDEPSNQIIGVYRDGHLSGYLFFTFEEGRHENFLSNSIHIYELIYETVEDLSQLLTFLHSQADQSETISFNTQDDSFYYLLQDPRMNPGAILSHVVAHESSIQGLGIMYRVLDVPRLFEVLHGHDFNGVSCRLQINLTDTFFPENAGSTIVEFIDGKARVAPGAIPQVALSLDVAEFSSLVIGAASLRKLLQFGLASLSDDAYIDRLDQLFSGPKPVCLTQF